MECSLAKPQADQKSVGGSNSQKSGLLSSYPPRVGYGFVGGGYGALGAGYGTAGFAQVRWLHVFICLNLLIIFYLLIDNQVDGNSFLQLAS